MNRAMFWINAARKQSLPQSLIPALLAVAIVCKSPSFSWSLSIWAVLGVVCTHLAMNLFDDYFDFRTKGTAIRENLAYAGIRARLGKCAYITSGETDLRGLLKAAITFAILGMIPAVIITFYRGFATLWFALVIGVLGIFYSAKPFALSYRGLGELVIGFIFGPLLMAGVAFYAGGELSDSVFWLSIPVGFLVANILFVHSIMDFEPDRSVGKMTLAVKIGSPQRMIFVLGGFLTFPFLTIFGAVLMGKLSLWYCTILLLVPMVIGLFNLMRTYVKNPQALIVRKFWMGPMENWERIEKTGISWFMIRWYVARNILVLYCFLVLVVSLIISR